MLIIQDGMVRETLLSKIRNKKDNGTRLNQNIVGTKSLLKDFNNFKKILTQIKFS